MAEKIAIGIFIAFGAAVMIYIDKKERKEE